MTFQKNIFCSWPLWRSPGSQSKEITALVLSKFLLPELKEQAGGSKIEFIRKMKITMKESTEKQEQESEAQIRKGVVGFDKLGHDQSTDLRKQLHARGRKHIGKKAGQEYQKKQKETRTDVIWCISRRV